ncbi:MAG: autotransporter-associated beta strand repeat-containing protein [Verrucomicrobia bacterium]|nr:autotransporter-associated beta strand repeat-containing protein [Verrucomicrobiota bacterium]
MLPKQTSLPSSSTSLLPVQTSPGGSLLRRLTLCLHFAIISHSTTAATLTWSGDVDSAWLSGTNGIDTNWVGDTLPANGDSLVFDLTTSGIGNPTSSNDLTGLKLGGTNAITFTNDSLTGTGFTLTGNEVTLGGNIISSGITGTHTHTLSLDLILSGTRAVNTGTGTTIVIDGTLSESGGSFGFTKTGAGAATLSGINTFTGAVSVNQGSLTANSIADGGAASALGAGTTIRFGTAGQTGMLIYTGTGASTNRSVVLASTGTGGGTVTNNGSGGLIFTGTFANSGAASKTFTLSGSNTSANEFQAALVDSNGSALSFVKSGLGAWTLSGSSSFTGAVSVNQGALTITSLADSGVNSAAGAGDTINLGSGTTTAGTLIYTGSGAVTNRAINLAATTSGGATISSSGSGGLIFAGVFSNAGSGTKTLTLGGTYTGGNKIQSVLSDGNGTLAIAKVDAGTWALSGDNTFSGTVSLSAGTLALNSATAIGTGTLILVGGTLDNTSGAALTLSTNNAVSLNGSITFGGTSSLSLGSGVVTLGNANRDITLNGSSTLTLGELQWNSVAGTRVLTVNQGTEGSAKLILGGFRLNINADTAARNRTISGTGDVEISGAVLNGNAFSNGLIYAGSGTLTLSDVNGYTGTTLVNGGTLKMSGSGSIATSSGLTISSGTFDVGDTAATVNGTLTLGTAATSVAGLNATVSSSVPGGSFTLGGNVTYNVGSAGFENGQATISASLVLNADRTLAVNDSPNAAVDVLVSGVISGGFGIVKSGSGTMRLSGLNTFSGQTQINNGVIEVFSIGYLGAAGSLGTADKDASSGIIRMGNGATTGTLNYLGTGEQTNRRIQAGSSNGATASGGATILSNGSGALVFTAATLNNAANVSATGPGTARVLTLGGSNTNDNTVLGAIVNNVGAGTSGTNALALTKQDPGLWILAGTSTYSGETVVNGGTLLVNNITGSATGSGSVFIGTAARLGGSGTAGSLSASTSITQESGGVIFAGHSGVFDAQTLTLLAGAGFSLSGSIELDITGGAASGLLNLQSGNNDRIVFSGGPVTLSGATLSLHTFLPLNSGTWTAGTSWKLFDWAGVTGGFDNLQDFGSQQGNLSGLPDLSPLGLGWDWSQLYTDGTLSVTALVPEPARTLFVLLGMMFVLQRRRRND